MNNIDREQLVERYLNGELTGSQEQDFFIKVAVDNEMRRTLRAMMIVDSAFRLDREVVSTDRPAVRARVMASLAASSLDPAPAGSGSRSPGATTTGAGSWNSRLWKGAIAVTASSALVVVSYLVGTGYLGSDTPEGGNTPAAVSAEHPGTAPQTALPGSSSGAAQGSTTGTALPQGTNAPDAAGERTYDLNRNDGASKIGAALGDGVGVETRAGGGRREEEAVVRNSSRRDMGSIGTETRRNSDGTSARERSSARGEESIPAGVTRSTEKIVKESENSSPRPVVSDEDTMRLKVRMRPR